MTVANPNRCDLAQECVGDPACPFKYESDACSMTDAAIDDWGKEPEPRTDLQDAVELDLRDLEIGPGKYALCAMARRLARVIDARGDDEPASQTAKAIETLRITMNQIMAKENNDPTLVRQLLEGLQTPGSGGSTVPPPVRYPPKPRPADAGRQGR